MKFQYGDNVLVKGKVLGIVEDGIKVNLIDDASNSNTMWFAEEQLIPDMTNIETIPQEEVMKSAYEHGLNDAWELVNKLLDISSDSIKKELFGTVFVTDIMKDYTPQEALAKMKEYKEAQIEVGDVIAIDDDRVIITKIIKGEPCTIIYGIEDDGCAICYSDKQFKKTGKHIDIKAILEQIGE